jgi:hypothetical protein
MAQEHQHAGKRWFSKATGSLPSPPTHRSHQAPAYWTQPARPLCQGSSICTPHLNASATDAVDDLGKSLKAYLVCGITSVNDYSVYGEMLAPLRALQGSGVLVEPRVKFAIRFGTPEGHGAEFGWGDYFT